MAKTIDFRKTWKILDKRTCGVDWVLKANFPEISNVLIEFAIAKLCSVFKIGPMIDPYPGFDVICFKDCIEFYMEKCEPFSYRQEYARFDSISNRLKFCLRVLHILRIVHKDIKPSNIVYSKSIGDYVLCDFGISAPII